MASHLQDSLRKDLSDRVLLLHGLSGWPSPHGSHALCEVDLSADANPTGIDKGVQVVIKAISGAFFRDKVTSCGGREHGDSFLDIQRLKIGEEEREAEGYYLENGIVEAVGNSSYSNCYSHSNLVSAEPGMVVEQEYGHSIVANLAVIAPGVSVRPASYDNLVPIVRDLLVNGNKEQKTLKPEDQFSCLPDEEVEQRVIFEGNRVAGNGISKIDDPCFGKPRHPNLAPILGILQGESYLYVVYPAVVFTIQSLLHFSPAALGDDQHIRLLIFQILSAIAYTHNQGLTHGDLRPSNILLTENLWCLITGFLRSPHKNIKKSFSPDCSSCSSPDSKSTCNLVGLHPETSIVTWLSDWRMVIKRWCAGEVSNYDYLLLLNKIAGRRWADPCFHTVMPWVIDFSVKPEARCSSGWRDLTKSKWRLAKGDEQLDFTFASAEMPHHVSDECLSELAVCIYKARRLPLVVLRRVVRSVYEPNEYPANMQRLYQWTPDECIPEFYSDAGIFESVHPGMNDLTVPPWANGVKDFASLHRAALESERVSMQLHHWIDLTFGYKLSGEAAVNAKNVSLSTAGPTVPRSSGRRQLFCTPHPQRQPCKITDSLKIQGDSLQQNIAFQMSEDSLKEAQEVVNSEIINASTSLETNKGAQSQGHDDEVHSAGAFSSLESLEEVTSFSESAGHLSPCYKLALGLDKDTLTFERQNQEESLSFMNQSPETNLEAKRERSSQYNPETFVALLDDSGLYKQLVESLDEEGDDGIDLYEGLQSVPKNVKHHVQASVGESEDIVAIGCIIAELYLQKPLFDHKTATLYRTWGTLPDLVDCLPPYVQSLVKSMFQRDLAQRPIAAELLNSPFFSSTIRAVYAFLAPLHLLSHRCDQLHYVARMARDGAFVWMGQSAAEMCAPSCLSLVVHPYEDIDVNAVMSLILHLLQALKPLTSKILLVPVVQRLLQSQQSSLLTVALLQDSFIKELWRVVGTGAYLECIHPFVLGSLRRAPSRSQATAASKVLVSMCLNLGVPITLHHTILPLLQVFGRDIRVDDIDVYVQIGQVMGEKLLVKHLLPPLRIIIEANVDLLVTEVPGPMHSWRLLSMVDAMAVLDRIRCILTASVVLRELLQEPNNIYMKVLLQSNLSPTLLQCAAKALLLVCDDVGVDATVSYVLPQLKQFFHGLAFTGKLEGASENCKQSTKCSAQLQGNEEDLQSFVSQDQLFLTSGTRSGGSNMAPIVKGKKVEDDVMLVHILYPGLASLVGIERLRQSFITWLLLEQALLKHCNWRWEGSDINQYKTSEKDLSMETGHDSVNPANLLLDGVGWSTPLSQSSKWIRSPSSNRRLADVSTEKLRNVSEFDIGEDPGSWSWVASKDTLWDAEAFSRIGSGFVVGKEDRTWSLSSTILHSWRAHTGLIRCTVLCEDENTVFTAGGGSRGGSVVREWNLGNQECVMEYAGHEEAVNDVCMLPGHGRLASCDGTIHIWNAQTGQRVALFDESLSSSSLSSSSSSPSSSSPVSSAGAMLNVIPGENGKILVDGRSGNGALLSNQSLTGGGLYSCIHSMEAEEKLLAGMVHGSLRFIDVEKGRALYSWRCGQMEAPLSSFVSAIACSGQGESMEGRKYSSSSSWVVAGLGSGLCRLLDCKSGTVMGQWRAHDGFITKLYVLEERYLISSSLDKTISLWDLRSGTSSAKRLQVFHGHKHGVTSFAVRGCDLLSAAGSKIGLSCLSKSPEQGDEKQLIRPQKLYSAERSNRSLSHISTIGVLPFSRLFLVGTEDGYLKICS